MKVCEFLPFFCRMPSRSIALLVCATVTFGLISAEPVMATDTTSIGSGDTARVDAHGVCRDIQNLGPNAVMVPHRISEEWSIGLSSFLSASHENLDVKRCFSPQGEYVSAGLQAACVIDTTGGLWCWGENGSGQAGVGTSSAVNTPTKVPLPGPVTEVSAGGNTTCAVIEDGRAYCWGLNNLGNGSVSSPTTTSPTGSPGSTTPQLVSGGHSFKRITAGYNFACGLTTVGSVLCWGPNMAGEMGTGKFDALRYLVPQQVLGLTSGFIDVEVGNGVGCALKNTNDLWCWGDRNFRNTSNASIGQYSSISPLPPTHVQVGVKYRDIDFHSGHACGVTISGALNCWGNSVGGEVGGGATGTSYRTVLASGVEKVSVGYSNTCVIRDGDAYCFGYNSGQEIGDGTKTKTSTPKLVVGLGKVSSISVGLSKTCAKLVSSEIKCWGTFIGSSTPVSMVLP